ncbi:MAG TPA: DUF2304 domain-containing protein [Candidatus Andersenbacteria bacterium]|nr:MAG: hypothetical protein A2854_02070 [Parcubacteria group bacterium RIFCSPHIGHO2_01_FULL_56_18]HLD25638.1 DUF2304 domain-containing protein [Candidatus Andersenbacteria bacterium]
MIQQILSGTIPARIQFLALVGSVILLGIIVNLIRREKLKEGYSIIWFLVGLAMVTFSALAGLLDVFARSVGISYSPAALFLILISGLLLLSIHFSVMVSKHDQRYRELAQEHALLRARLEAAERGRHG